MCFVAALGFLIASSQRGEALALVAAQSFGVAWLISLSLAATGTWTNATFITAVSWIALFLAPCWIYALDPSLLTTSHAVEQPIALVDLSLFSLIAGVMFRQQGWSLGGRRRKAGITQPQPMPVVTSAPPLGRQPSERWLIVWGVVGLASLAILMARNGGPIAYITHQDKSTQLNRGLTYLIWGMLFLRFAPLSAIASRWARGARAGRNLTLYLVAGCALVVVTGARAFVAVAAVQILLVYSLLHRPPRLRTILVPAVVAGFLLVFGFGAVKRFQAYNQTHVVHKSFGDYLATVAPNQALSAYVNNYVDGVSLTALAQQIVPAKAGYEYGKIVLRVLLKPIPSPYRPDVSEAPALRAAFNPPGGFAYAIPLQATMYIQFGLPGIAVAFLGVGILLAHIDARLLAAGRANLRYLLVLATAAVQVPIFLRSGLPNGLVFALLDIAGMYLAGVTVLGSGSTLRARLRLDADPAS